MFICRTAVYGGDLPRIIFPEFVCYFLMSCCPAVYGGLQPYLFASHEKADREKIIDNIINQSIRITRTSFVHGQLSKAS